MPDGDGDDDDVMTMTGIVHYVVTILDTTYCPFLVLPQNIAYLHRRRIVKTINLGAKKECLATREINLFNYRKHPYNIFN